MRDIAILSSSFRATNGPLQAIVTLHDNNTISWCVGKVETVCVFHRPVDAYAIYTTGLAFYKGMGWKVEEMDRATELS